MNRNFIHSTIAILLLFGLVACVGIEIPNNPTTTPVLSSTLFPEPTSTLAPTETPVPRMTPSPVPAATFTPTPVPQIGDIRISPDTGREQIFIELGEWVEIFENEDGLQLIIRVRNMQATADSLDFASEELSRIAEDLVILAELEAIAKDADLKAEKNKRKDFIYFTDAKGKTDLNDAYGEGTFTVIAADSKLNEGFFTLSIADFNKALSDYGRLAFVKKIDVNSDGEFVAVDVSGNVISKQVYFDLSDGGSTTLLLPADTEVEGNRFQLKRMWAPRTYYLDQEDGLVYQVGDERQNPSHGYMELLRDDGSWAELSLIGLPLLMEAVSEDQILQKMEDPRYDYGWPIYKEPNNYDYNYTGKYIINGFLTNHSYEEIYLGDTGEYEIRIMSDFFYKDAAGSLQKIKIPLLIQNNETEYSFNALAAGGAWPFLWWDGKDDLMMFTEWWKLDSTGKLAYAVVRFLREEYTGERWRVYEPRYDVEDNSYMVGERPREVESDQLEVETIVIESGDFLAQINDYLGVTQDSIVEFTQRGDPKLLGKIDGEPILLPSFIQSEDFE